MTDDIFRDVYDSVDALYGAFYPPHEPDFDTRWRVYSEEAAEFATAALYHNCDGEPVPGQHSLEEWADMLYTSFGVMQALGYNLFDLEQALAEVVAKNAAKRPANGYTLDSKGKIRKAAP